MTLTKTMKELRLFLLAVVFSAQLVGSDVAKELSPIATDAALYWGDPLREHCDLLEKSFNSEHVTASETDRKNALGLINSIRGRISDQIDLANTVSRSAGRYGSSELVYQAFNLYHQIAASMDAVAILERIVVEKATSESFRSDFKKACAVPRQKGTDIRLRLISYAIRPVAN